MVNDASMAARTSVQREELVRIGPRRTRGHLLIIECVGHNLTEGSNKAAVKHLIEAEGMPSLSLAL